MRQNPNSRRSRGRGNRKPGNSRNQIFDSNGPGARVRGNSAQIYEKYQQLARDASSSGDRVAAEGFYQHAEHYFRLMEAAGLNREGNPQDQSQQQHGDDAPRNGNVAPNAESAVVAEPVPQRNPQRGPQRSPQPNPQPDTQPASEHAPESVAALIEAVEQGSAGQQEKAAPEVTNGSAGDEEVAAKPARRPRARRANGSANGKSKPVKSAEGDAPEEGPDSPPEDNEPVSA